MMHHPFAPNGADTMPQIPLWLAHRPVLGGLTVPWITARGVDGRYLFGALDANRQHQAVWQHRCQVCGHRLGERSILLMRLSDLGRQSTTKPALDPVCAAYSALACPMIAGRMAHYRSTPAPLGHGLTAAVDQSARLGATAEPWFAVWLPRYEPIDGPSRTAARLLPRHPPAAAAADHLAPAAGLVNSANNPVRSPSGRQPLGPSGSGNALPGALYKAPYQQTPSRPPHRHTAVELALGKRGDAGGRSAACEQNGETRCLRHRSR